jgi:hypothetical protein
MIKDLGEDYLTKYFGMILAKALLKWADVSPGGPQTQQGEKLFAKVGDMWNEKVKDN